MGAATTLDRDMLIKLLGMMGSHNEHERASFSAKADDLVREAGMTWKEVLGQQGQGYWHERCQSLQEEYTELAITVACLEREKLNAEATAKRAAAQTRKVREEMTKQIEALRAEVAALKPKPDAWEPKVRAFLSTFADNEWTTAFLLEHALGVPVGQQNPDYGRRLGRVMRAIGGWRHSTNVSETRVRGWKRILDSD